MGKHNPWLAPVVDWATDREIESWIKWVIEKHLDDKNKLVFWSLFKSIQFIRFINNNN